MKYPKLFCLCVLMAMSLSTYCQESQAASQDPFPPPKDAPKNASRGTGGRGECDGVDFDLEPLIPINTWGLTLKSSPKVWAHIKYYSKPSNRNISGTFTLQQRKPVQGSPTRYTVDLPNTSSVFSIPIESTLQDNGWYNWTLEISCKNQGKTPDNISGVISRISSITLDKQLENSLPSNLPSIYNDYYLWYDVLNKLAKLRCDNPNDSTYKSAWSNLMKMEEFQLSDDLSQSKLVCN
jgi:Domain of Unknown Function (DUF928)